MKTKQWILTGTLLTAATLLFADLASRMKTFRSVALFGVAFQSSDALSPTTPVYGFATLDGIDLVNLALGTDLTTPRTNEVLAFEVASDSSAANLVVYSKILDSNIVTLATSTRFDKIVQQDDPLTPFPNRERFVAQMNFASHGFLTSGRLTISGRMYLNPSTGCPQTVVVDFDRLQDKLFADKKLKDAQRGNPVLGVGHVIGVVDVIFSNGSTNVVLIPFGRVNMRRQLQP